MNTPVSFPISKLLKEKRFEFRQNEIYYNPVNGFTTYEEITPTITEVVMWLYEKLGIWIQPTICSDKTFKVGCIELNNYPLVEHIVKNKNEQLYFNSPTEAYEAAIEYVLNKDRQ